jgi:hypothetical protein
MKSNKNSGAFRSNDFGCPCPKAVEPYHAPFLINVGLPQADRACRKGVGCSPAVCVSILIHQMPGLSNNPTLPPPKSYFSMALSLEIINTDA